MEKKNVLFLVVFCLFSVSAMAQAPLGQGNKQINAGLGFTNEGLPVYVGMDFGIHPDVTIGPVASIRAWRETYRFDGDRFIANHLIFFAGFNGNYHFNRLLEIPSNFDFYAGGTIGFYVWSSPNDYIGPNASGLGINAQIGGRYFIDRNFALNMEIGGGSLAGGRFGITYILR
jgi:hypothetical protein